MKRLFAKIATQYDRMNRLMSLALDRRWRRLALDAASTPARSAVLDLACGTGDFAAEVRRRWPDAEITGVDLTPEMLTIARTKFSEAANGIRFVEADAQNLAEFPDGTFGLAVCAFGFRNFPDKPKALAECRRVLASGGELVVLELFRPESRVAGALVNLWLTAIAALFARGARKEYTYLRSSVANTVSAGEFAALAEKAGFAVKRKRRFFPSATCLILTSRGT